MGREADPTIKADLLERVTNYILKNGLQDLSLRPLAEALGTSARMLIYHFGSKEQLIIEALANALNKQQALMQQQMVSSKSGKKTLQNFWTWFTSEEVMTFARLLYDIENQGINGNAQYLAFAKAIFEGWEAFVQHNVKSLSPEQVRLVVGVISGLLLYRLVTGKVEETNQAFGAFLKTLHFSKS
jgi:AcrR family transcriptional regulator